MKIEFKKGFEEWEDLKKTLMEIELPVEIKLDDLEQYSQNWQTIIIPLKEAVGIRFVKGRSFFDEIRIKDENGKVHARFYKDLEWGVEAMGSGPYTSLLTHGKKYIFGRIPKNQGGELYCISIKPEGKYDIRKTGQYVSEEISEIQWYARREDDKLIIVKLGPSPLFIEFCRTAVL